MQWSIKRRSSWCTSPTRPTGGFQDRFIQLRSLIAWVIGIGLLMGILLGWGLAFSLERSLDRATAAITQLSEKSIEKGFSGELQTLKEEGPNEIRLLIRAFNIMTEKLQTLEVSRRRLLANLVHELGRPLGAMHSAIQALENGADEDPKLKQELLTGIDNEIGRLRHLIEDLAKLYHQPLGPRDLDLKPLNLNEWLPALLAPWREAAQANTFFGKLTYPHPCPPF
jgi:signal transduction histidine kinase